MGDAHWLELAGHISGVDSLAWAEIYEGTRRLHTGGRCPRVLHALPGTLRERAGHELAGGALVTHSALGNDLHGFAPGGGGAFILEAPGIALSHEEACVCQA